MAGRFGPFIRRAAGSAARPTRRGAVSLLFALGVMVLPFAAMGSPGQSGSSIPTLPAGSTVELNDDDAGQALFDLPAMEPGHPVSRCIAVTYAGSAEVPVGLYGAVTGNGLDRYLNMTVESGSGGGDRDCTGFSGEPMFQGTMATFMEQYRDHASGLMAFNASSASATRTFRFTFELQDDAAAEYRGVSAAFTWEAQWDLAPAPETPAETPAEPGGTEGSPAIISTPRHKPDLVAEGRGVKTARKPAKAAPAAEPAEDDAQNPFTKLIRSVGKLAPPVLERSVFPAVLVGMLIVFIAVQDRIDRGDPKLALAPVQAEHLEFEL